MQVFDTVAQPIVAATLQGFNGTLFAYGQTGSGKTFTMTGGAESYEQRGIITRTVALIFQQIEARKDHKFVVRHFCFSILQSLHLLLKFRRKM